MPEGDNIINYIQLTKAPLSLFIALTALLGFVIGGDGFNIFAVRCFVAVFLLAAGCAALNNVQDHSFDQALNRTKDRPLPTGNISKKVALALAVILCSLGLSGLAIIGTSKAGLLGGISAVVLYNFIYTPLKQHTILAILPGTFCGMLPPLIGWLLAGGTTLTPGIVVAMLIVGLWQLPHFWLVLLYHAKDYQQSAMPSMLKFFSLQQIKRITFCWVLSFAFMTLFMPYFRVVTSASFQMILVINAVLLSTIFGYHCIFKKMSGVRSFRPLFVHLNSALLVVVVLAIIDNI